jgi:hypothetical protein
VHLAARTAILSFIVVFGVTKALTNYFAGRFSDRFGRKVVLVAGWLVAAPVPFALMWAPSWSWILAANVLLGVSQGLTWSTTVIMKIDQATVSANRWRDHEPLSTSIDGSLEVLELLGHIAREAAKSACGAGITVAQESTLRRRRAANSTKARTFAVRALVTGRMMWTGIGGGSNMGRSRTSSPFAMCSAT